MTDDPQEIMAQLQMLQGRLQAVDRQSALIERDLNEAQQASDTLRGLEEGDGELAVMVPVGGGVQVPARVEPKSTVLMQIGAGYATRGGIPDALERLRAQVETLQEQLAQVNTEADRLVQTGQVLQQKLAAQDAQD